MFVHISSYEKNSETVLLKKKKNFAIYQQFNGSATLCKKKAGSVQSQKDNLSSREILKINNKMIIQKDLKRGPTESLFLKISAS